MTETETQGAREREREREVGKGEKEVVDINSNQKSIEEYSFKLTNFALNFSVFFQSNIIISYLLSFAFMHDYGGHPSKYRGGSLLLNFRNLRELTVK